MAERSGTKLTDAKLRNIQPQSPPLTDAATAGLIFLPSSKTRGSGSWQYRYTQADGKRAKLTLGRYPDMSLSDAQNLARELNAIAADGASPKLYLSQQKIKTQQQQINTFEHVAQMFFQREIDRGAWKNPQDPRRWQQRMGDYVFPFCGDVPITDVSAQMVAETLKPIWSAKAETATKVSIILGQVFVFSEALGLSQHHPMKAAKILLGPQKLAPAATRRQPAMQLQYIPDFVAGLSSRTTDQALKFLILTGARSGAVRFMQWGDVDLEAGVWTLKPEREGSKTHIERYFPLSKQALEILQDLPREGDLVFTGKNGGAVSDATFTMHLRRSCGAHQSDIVGRVPTSHGFRAAFKNWSASAGYDDRLSEIQLCHVVGGAVHQAYFRDQLLDNRLVMMQAWADFCCVKCGALVDSFE